MTEQHDVRVLADRAAIRDVMARYYQGLDRRKYAQVGACFTPDIHADYRGRFFDGPEAVVDHCRGLDNFQMATHLMGECLIEIDGETAKAVTYATDRLRGGDEGQETDITHGLRYIDGFVREGGEWRIRRRRMVGDWERVDPVTG